MEASFFVGFLGFRSRHSAPFDPMFGPPAPVAVAVLRSSVNSWTDNEQRGADSQALVDARSGERTPSPLPLRTRAGRHRNDDPGRRAPEGDALAIERAAPPPVSAR
jgi:hypothetical protein